MIEIKRTLDVGSILSVLRDDNIFKAICEDGFNKEDFNPNVIEEYWVEFTLNNELLGVAQFKPLFSNCFDSHIHVLPEKREHSIGIGKGLINWCNENIPNSLLYTTVPESCQNVVRFLINFDFEQTGTLKKAFTKNGKHEDLNILTRLL